MFFSSLSRKQSICVYWQTASWHAATSYVCAYFWRRWKVQFSCARWILPPKNKNHSVACCYMKSLQQTWQCLLSCSFCFFSSMQKLVIQHFLVQGLNWSTEKRHILKVSPGATWRLDLKITSLLMNSKRASFPPFDFLHPGKTEIYRVIQTDFLCGKWFLDEYPLCWRQ